MADTELVEQKLREVENALDAWGSAKELANELYQAAFHPSQHPEPFSDKVARLNAAIRLAQAASDEVTVL